MLVRVAIPTACFLMVFIFIHSTEALGSGANEIEFI
jgi:hypothetical protein